MWIAVSTHIRAEDNAQINIERQGYECFCPKVETNIRHARKTRTVRKPFFPGYIFVNIDPDRDRWRAIESSRGVRSVIRFGLSPSAVPEQFINELMALDKAESIQPTTARERFNIGQKIRCYGAAFHDLIGQIINIDDKDRIWVLMEIMGGQVPIRLSADNVIKA